MYTLTACTHGLCLLQYIWTLKSAPMALKRKIIYCMIRVNFRPLRRSRENYKILSTSKSVTRYPVLTYGPCCGHCSEHCTKRCCVTDVANFWRCCWASTIPWARSVLLPQPRQSSATWLIWKRCRTWRASRKAVAPAVLHSTMYTVLKWSLVTVNAEVYSYRMQCSKQKKGLD